MRQKSLILPLALGLTTVLGACQSSIEAQSQPSRSDSFQTEAPNPNELQRYNDDDRDDRRDDDRRDDDRRDDDRHDD